MSEKEEEEKEKEEPLAWMWYGPRTPGSSRFVVSNETDLPITLELRLDGVKAPGFVENIPKSHLWIAPSAVTRVWVTIRMAKMSFWQKLKWLLGMR